MELALVSECAQLVNIRLVGRLIYVQVETNQLQKLMLEHLHFLAANASNLTIIEVAQEIVIQKLSSDHYADQKKPAHMPTCGYNMN